MPFACVRYGRARFASTARLGAAQFRMKVAAPLGREVEHIPKRVEGIVVTVFLAGLRWHVKDFRSPEMVNAVAIAPKNVSRGRLGHLGLSAHAGAGAQRGSDEPACVSVQLNRSRLLPSSPTDGNERPRLCESQLFAPLWISTSNWLRDPQLASCRRPKHSPQIGRSQLQKRKRNPTVGAMLLRWRKPLANPPFTCVNMMPE